MHWRAYIGPHHLGHGPDVGPHDDLGRHDASLVLDGLVVRLSLGGRGGLSLLLHTTALGHALGVEGAGGGGAAPGQLVTALDLGTGHDDIAMGLDDGGGEEAGAGDK